MLSIKVVDIKLAEPSWPVMPEGITTNITGNHTDDRT